MQEHLDFQKRIIKEERFLQKSVHYKLQIRNKPDDQLFDEESCLQIQCPSPSKGLLKNENFTSLYILDSTVSRKMNEFDKNIRLFVCFHFSISREVTNRGFLGMAHLPVGLMLHQTIDRRESYYEYLFYF